MVTSETAKSALLTQLTKARHKVDRATARLAAEQAERDALVGQAFEAGISGTVISSTAGVSQGRSYQVRDRLRDR